MAHLYKTRGLYEDAEECFLYLLRHGYDACAYDRAVLLEENLGMTDVALQYYFVAHLDGNLDATNKIGEMHFAYGNLAQARMWFTEAADGGHGGAAANLARL